VKNNINIPTPRYQPKLVQINAMKSHYPGFIVSYDQEGELFFTGEIQPSPVMPVYTVSIQYRENKMPWVKVLHPTLAPNRPHFYKSIGGLCLYKPENFSWSAAKPISTYIVSWTACWLYFYEVWKETGTWYGPEAEHDPDTPKQPEK
jgi:hypothetical protein